MKEFKTLYDTKDSVEKVIYVVKPILVPSEALEPVKLNAVERQWRVYNQVLNR